MSCRRRHTAAPTIPFITRATKDSRQNRPAVRPDSRPLSRLPFSARRARPPKRVTRHLVAGHWTLVQCGSILGYGVTYAVGNMLLTLWGSVVVAMLH
jgi:hypothetical protein